MSTQIRCPHCKQSFNHVSQTHHSLHRSSCAGDGATFQTCTSDEVSVIYEEVRILDATIQQLQAKRSMLLDKVNAIRARTAILPLELLSRIFRFVHSSQPFYTHPHHMRIEPRPPVLQLAAVCSAWRQVAFSMPDLWTTLSMILLHPTDQDDASMLQTFLEHARELPVALKLNFGFCDFENFSLGGTFRSSAGSFSNKMHSKRRPNINSKPTRAIPSEHVLETLLSNAGKIRVLQINHMPHNWIVGNDWERFTNLQDLRLLCDEERNDKIHFPNGIQKLFLQNVVDYTMFLQRSAPNITDLEIHDAPMNISITLLAECPNLIRCRSATPRDHCDGTPPFWINTPMQHLKILDWEWPEFGSDMWHRAFLQRFQFPALRKLRWKVSELAEDELVAHFFKRLPLTLKKLELVFVCGVPEKVTDSLLTTALWVPHLPELAIDLQVSYWVYGLEANEYNTRAVLNILGQKNLSPSGGPPFLPALKKLCLRMKLPQTLGPDDSPCMEFDQLARTLVTRREMGLIDFQLFWDGNLDFANDGNMEKLRELVREGLRLEIIKRSNRIFPEDP